MSRSLEDWLDYIQTLHFREIDLTLERVRTVYTRLYPSGVSFRVMTIAGTNGKGSTAELLSSIYCAAGHRVGKFTSPHLIAFNERFMVDGQAVDDQALLAAFERVEHARQDTPITFFEFCTLLAIELFVCALVDLVVMEVGLGGRLDAVNILDADVALITSISLDHTAWLGDTLEAIANEKAGIVRAGRPCVIGIEEPQARILQACDSLGALPQVIGQAFSYQHLPASVDWAWSNKEQTYRQLPLPFGQSGVQLSNAAVAIQATRYLNADLPVDVDDVRRGLASATVLGRCQVMSRTPLIILDVAHNHASVARLKEFVQSQETDGRVFAVCGMLKDKDIGTSLTQLLPIVDKWHIATIDNERGATGEEIEAILQAHNNEARTLAIECYQRIQNAYTSALELLDESDCLLVFGSFFVVGDILSVIKTAVKPD